MRELTLHNLIHRVDALPEVPQVAFRVIQLLNIPDTAVSQLAELIGADQALTAKLLRLCNSAYYGLSRTVTTVSEAIMIVGFSAVKSMVLMITTQSTMNKGLLGYKIKPGEFWRHSLGTAESARLIAKQCGDSREEESFTAGLIHDIGKMVLNQCALPEVYRATNLMQKENISIYAAEARILGFNHAEAGATLADRWRFPPLLVDAIRYHHEFNHAPSDNLPFIIAVANVTAELLYHDNPEMWARLNQHAPLIQARLGIHVDDLKNLLPEIHAQIDKTSNLVMATS